MCLTTVLRILPGRPALFGRPGPGERPAEGRPERRRDRPTGWRVLRGLVSGFEELHNPTPGAVFQQGARQFRH